MLKKSLSLIISIVLVFSSISAVAQNSLTNADRLNTLGLFKGTGTGYSLENSATRIHALIMLIRLLGEENAALSYTGECPFSDIAVPSYKLYAGYAYSKGYTSGTGNGTFTPDKNVTFRDYVTFLLRALGYSDKEGDFSYSECFYLAGLIGLIDPNSAYTLSVSDKVFYRADMVDLSVAALTTAMKGTDKALASVLLGKGVFSTENARNANILAEQEPYVYTEKDYSTTFTHANKTYNLPSGSVKADVIYVNLQNPAVKVKVATANNNSIGTTEAFSSIVNSSNAAIVINSNFFESYGSVPVPVGHVMSNGEFLYGVSGMYSFGFTDSGTIKVGSPALFFTVKGQSSQWACYELNSLTQTADNSVLYTPAFGTEITTKCPAMIVKIENSTITMVQNVAENTSVTIPQNGYLMFFGKNYTSTHYFSTPAIGDTITMTPTLFTPDSEGFTMDNVSNIVSGGPRLVKDGSICTTLEAFYRNSRFTTDASPRTAIGRDIKGNLIIISSAKATIQQLRELMHTLGCVDAINLDGGASAALAINGKILRAPGRNLAATLQIFVN